MTSMVCRPEGRAELPSLSGPTGSNRVDVKPAVERSLDYDAAKPMGTVSAWSGPAQLGRPGRARSLSLGTVLQWARVSSHNLGIA